ncbi:MAG: cupin domain-containing protein [Pseudomonadota bacterium]
MVQIAKLDALPLEMITSFDSCGVRSAVLGASAGETHCYYLDFAAGSEIGPHPTGFQQRFIVLSGSGWVAGADGERRPVRAGEMAMFRPGEMHAKGSDGGMRVLMLQLAVEPPGSGE